MIALRYFATGKYFAVLGDLYGVNKSSVSRAVHSVASVLKNEARFYIKFPTKAAEIRKTMVEFSEIYAFSNVIGAVDGSNVCLTFYYKLNLCN